MRETAVIRVLVVDDHPMVRSSLRMALDAEEDIEVVAEAADGDEALRACYELQPDVVLMDLRLPGRDGIATTRALQSRKPVPRVVVLTAAFDERLVSEALAAGACGYVHKLGEAEEILAAIRAAHIGQRATL